LESSTVVAKQEQVLEGQSVALSLLTGIRTLTRFTDRVYTATGWGCGITFLLLGIFITYQSVARKFGWPQAPATDRMSGYALALAATWAFSYALRTGSHVRIDVLLPFMPPKVRAVADWLALASIGFFTSITAWKVWVMVLTSYQIHSISNDYPLTPLWIPQMLVAIGFSLLGFTTIEMMASMMAEGFLPVLHRTIGGTVQYRPVSAGRADGPAPAKE
jgi:TRAP-type mannitol/chloroaromatic compound transport system permease small subunit